MKLTLIQRLRYKRLQYKVLQSSYSSIPFFTCTHYLVQPHLNNVRSFASFHSISLDFRLFCCFSGFTVPPFFSSAPSCSEFCECWIRAWISLADTYWLVSAIHMCVCVCFVNVCVYVVEIHLIQRHFVLTLSA